MNKEIPSKSKNKDKYNLLSNKPQKRNRDYSPSKDLEDEDEIMQDNNNINNNKKNKIKRRKVPLTKLVERITLNDPEENPKKTKKKKRSIKIFSDMSISEISNNLFKNYYPCILPEYYTDQIYNQIIENQIDKLMSNFIKEKKDEIKHKKIKINNNMDYLRSIAAKQGEWIEYEQNYDDNDYNNDEEKGYKSYDSNSENNSKNSYPEDESIEEEREQNFEDNYDYYENEDDYNNGDDYN